MTNDDAPRQAAPRAAARIDLGAIRANIARLREVAGPADVMAVVKADGYGHGLVPSAKAAVEGGATWLGVAFVEEALKLREALIQERILAWLAVPGEPLVPAVRAGVDLSASAPWMVDEVARAADQVGAVARMHLKVDTGLSRAGATAADWPALVEAARKAEASGAVEVVGVWSHLAHGDNPRHPTSARQITAFRDAVAIAEDAGLRPEVRHLANSGGTLGLPEAHFDLVRVGIATYGLSPGEALGGPADLGLRPAMSLSARLALAKPVAAGNGVSYGHTYSTSADTVLGLVPLGYADGVPRAAANRAEVLVTSRDGARRRPIAGTVCMDQFVVDLGAGAAAAAGDEVLLFGPGDHGEPDAHDWARAIGTIAYEVVTRIGARVPRLYEG